MIVMEFEPDSDFSVIPIYRKLLGRGHITGYTASANILRFYPPLIIEQEHITQLVTDLNDILSR
jgi:acetylornithine/succinyldiaminopimelate/putrescine aminotransferase